MENAIPEKLPNPNAITFTGAVEATYDGSQPVKVEIPEGGGGGAYYLFFNSQSGDVFVAPGTYAAIKDAIENKKFVDFRAATWQHGNGAGDIISYSVLDRMSLDNDGIIRGTCDQQSYVFTINPDDTGTWFYDN